MMMYINRAYNLVDLVRKDKVLVIYGPRQVGKTTLVEQFINNNTQKTLYVTGNDIDAITYLSSESLSKIKEFVAGYELLIVDEAQRIPNIGNSLKLISDKIKNLQVIVTGSASFELSGQIGEPLTGRKRTIIIYPISQFELLKIYTVADLKQKLSQFLIYGLYPEVVASGDNIQEKKDVLYELITSYLLKDVLELEKVKSSKVLWDLLKLIALQIGNEVSLNELSGSLGINKKTIARYLDLLEKAFVLYNVRGYSGNLRKEITKKSKYYFYDIGVRNAILGNFSDLDSRNDIGQLWENFIFMERIKSNTYKKERHNIYFWRTWDQKEIDLVEEKDGVLYGYEFKWNINKKIKAPKLWFDTYENAKYKVITPENYLNFLK